VRWRTSTRSASRSSIRSIPVLLANFHAHDVRGAGRGVSGRPVLRQAWTGFHPDADHEQNVRIPVRLAVLGPIVRLHLVRIACLWARRTAANEAA